MPLAFKIDSSTSVSVKASANISVSALNVKTCCLAMMRRFILIRVDHIGFLLAAVMQKMLYKIEKRLAIS